MKSTALAMTLSLSFVVTVATANPWHEPSSPKLEQADTSIVQSAAVEKVIKIEPDTRWVNVRRLETIRFIVGEGAHQIDFVRRIDGNASSFSLKDIAPKAATGLDQVTVFVAPDRLTRR